MQSMFINDTNSSELPLLLDNYFGILDYVILALVLGVSLAVGIASGWRRSTSTREFLTGGKEMNPVAVGLSLLGGVVSTISLQGNSTEMYLYGTQLWLNILGCIWGAIIIIFLILPVTYPLNLVSVCEYLDMRFQSALLKKLGSLTLIVNNFLYMGVCLYAPSIAVSSVMGIPISASYVILGVICAIYISVGGVRAVVYTDVVQTLIMFIGVLAAVIKVTIDLGGSAKVWEIAEEGGRIQFLNMDPSPLVRHSFWSVQVLGMSFMISVVGISQAQFQRLVSVKSLRISQGLCAVFTIGLAALWSLFYFSGLVAYAAYADCDPVSSGKIEKADQILPYMVGDKLSHITGMVGLFVSAIAGAVLSSLSSQASCTVLILWQDFLNGWWIFSTVSPNMATMITKIMSSVIVLLAIICAFLVAQLGTVFQVAYSIAGAIMGPFSGLFITSITAPWVNAKGAISGFLVALSINLWLVMGKFYYGVGQSSRLPMSTDGCLGKDENFKISYNVTGVFEDPTSIFFSNITEIPNPNVQESSNGWGYLSVYEISYCYLGSIGIIVVFIVSTITSILTGVVKPSEMDMRLVNQLCFRLYSRLYTQWTKSAKTVSLGIPTNGASKPTLDRQISNGKDRISTMYTSSNGVSKMHRSQMSDSGNEVEMKHFVNGHNS